jgi:hypothetical protein
VRKDRKCLEERKELARTQKRKVAGRKKRLETFCSVNPHKPKTVLGVDNYVKFKKNCV